MHPIPDKAEVALEFPDKLYIGTFERSSRFDAHLDGTGISLSLHRTGAVDERRSVRMHFHYSLFAEILRDLAGTAVALPAEDAAHRVELRDAAAALCTSLASDPPPAKTKVRSRARRDDDEHELGELRAVAPKASAAHK
jgi:hypothetical protein